MNRIETIKERIENYKSEYLPYFNNNGEMQEWAEMFGDLQYLLQRLERYEKALQEIRNITPYGMYHEIIDTALRED